MFEARVRVLGLLCLTGLVLVWARVAHLQLGLGPWHRANLADQETRVRLFPAPRGTIRAADGTLLAQDRCDADLAVHFRYLERPLDEAWLTNQARARLPRRQRRVPAELERARAQLRGEIESMWRRLSELTGIDEPELDRRARFIQQRVERIAESVNRRRCEQWAQATALDAAGHSAENETAWHRLCAWLADAPRTDSAPPEPVTVLEQFRYYAIAENVAPDVLLAFTANPEHYPGVRLHQRIRRVYPQQELACGVIGYVEPPLNAHVADERLDGLVHSGLGRAGVEGFYDVHLRGVPGEVREQIGSRSSVPRVLGGRPPQPGRDLVLTIDLRLQQFAEQLLEQAVHGRPRACDPAGHAASGAIVVLDVHTGAVLVAAALPRFDPNVAADPNSAPARILATRADSPLFNRAVQMSLPPGSTFKPVVALAALKAGVRPDETFWCRGYLHDADKLRCLIYRHHGVGHEAVDMPDAVVRSCNVYFLHLSERIGAPAIARWATAFGFGRRTGIDIAGEEPGLLPIRGGDVGGDVSWGRGPDALNLAIGQGAITATPLQLAVLMAAIANGGFAVVPHVRCDAFQPPRAVEGIDSTGDQSLAAVRAALARVVADPRGTAHQHVFLPEIAIAGKTGTAQSGSPRGDHAWFAGYVPATDPQFAIVAVLEHAGLGGEAAGPLVRELVQHMLAAGSFTGIESSRRHDGQSQTARR